MCGLVFRYDQNVIAENIFDTPEIGLMHHDFNGGT